MVLCPLVTKSLFGDVLFTMPVYLIFFAYYKEYRSGTCQCFLNYFFLNLILQLVVTAIYIPVSLAKADLPDTLEWAFFTILMTELYKNMMHDPNKQISFIWFTLPHKAVIFLVLLLLNLIISYDFFNIAAVVLVGQALVCFRNKNPLQAFSLKFDELIGTKICCCLDGVYITA